LVGVVFVAGCGQAPVGLPASSGEQICPPGPPVVAAWQAGGTLSVTVCLPAGAARASALTMGLLLADRTVGEPVRLRWVRPPGGGELRFVVDHTAGAAAADGGVFSLVQGFPDSEPGQRLGIALGVSTRDGGPFPWDHRLELPAAGTVPPLCSAPTASFRLRAVGADQAGDVAFVAMPADASIAGDGGPAVAARASR